MFMLGPVVNAVVVLVCGALGSLFRRGIPPRISETVNQGLSMCILAIGIRGVVKPLAGANFVVDNLEIIAVICMALGIVIGECLDIDGAMKRLGIWVQGRLSRPDATGEAGKMGSSIGDAFVTTTMVLCVGAWATTGAISAGVGDSTSLYAKSVVDGISALMFASTLGWGVSFAGFSVLLYEGGLALIAYLLGGFLSATAIGAMGMVGSIVIMLIALNMLGATRIRAANCIPAVFLPALVCLIFGC